MNLGRWQQAGFGLYIHWPFCQSKCPYCDFNSHVADRVDLDRWARAFRSEIKRYADITGPRVLSSIFFGGGTPSLMTPELVESVIDSAVSVWSPANAIEITLEGNPTSIEIGKFRSFRSAGVNRVSIGVQALNNGDLRRLGRMHSRKEAVSAISAAQAVFDRSSFDLIYARQDQTPRAWREELSEALSLGSGHLSLYQLTIEDGTVFGERHARGVLRGLPDEDRSVILYEVTQEFCSAAGLPAYEVSNHALPGHESVHNQVYWRSGDWVGVGPGAHGRLTLANGDRIATSGHRTPVMWLQAAERGDGDDTTECLTSAAKTDEFLVMGMRLRQGIDLTDMHNYLSHTIDLRMLQDLLEADLITATETSVSATPKGMLLLNFVIERLSRAVTAVKS